MTNTKILVASLSLLTDAKECEKKHRLTVGSFGVFLSIDYQKDVVNKRQMYITFFFVGNYLFYMLLVINGKKTLASIL